MISEYTLRAYIQFVMFIGFPVIITSKVHSPCSNNVVCVCVCVWFRLHAELISQMNAAMLMAALTIVSTTTPHSTQWRIARVHAPAGERSIAINMSVCLSVREHISCTTRPNFTQILSARRYASEGISYGSVSVCVSVTRRCCIKTYPVYLQHTGFVRLIPH